MPVERFGFRAPAAVAQSLGSCLRSDLRAADDDEKLAVGAVLRRLAEYVERGEVLAMRLQWNGDRGLELSLALETPVVVDAQCYIDLAGRVRVIRDDSEG